MAVKQIASFKTYSNFRIKKNQLEDLQDGGVRCGNHLPPHKYIKNTSTCRTTPTEHLGTAGRRPQTSQKARNSPCTRVGQKKKEKTETKEQRWDLHLWEGALKEEKFPHTKQPLHCQKQGVGWGEASDPQGRTQQKGCRGQSGKIPAQRIGADQHSLAREACLFTHQGGWGLGAEAQASEVRYQGEDWSWLSEHSLKGASAPQLARRESGKISGTA